MKALKNEGMTPRSKAERGHGSIIVLVMERVRQNSESSLIKSVISNQILSLQSFLREGRVVGLCWAN